MNQKSHCVLWLTSDMEVLQSLEVKVLARVTFNYAFSQLHR